MGIIFCVGNITKNVMNKWFNDIITWHFMTFLSLNFANFAVLVSVSQQVTIGAWSLELQSVV